MTRTILCQPARQVESVGPDYHPLLWFWLPRAPPLSEYMPRWVCNPSPAGRVMGGLPLQVVGSQGPPGFKSFGRWRGRVGGAILSFVHPAGGARKWGRPSSTITSWGRRDIKHFFQQQEAWHGHRNRQTDTMPNRQPHVRAISALLQPRFSITRKQQ